MTVETILSAILVGAVLGVLGRIIVPGRNRLGCLLTVGVGILAALAGTALAEASGIVTTGWSWAEFGIQVLVAAFGVALLAGFTRKR